MQVYKIDVNGYFIRDTILQYGDNLPNDCIWVRPPQNPTYYKPKWTGNAWVEGKTENEFLEDGFLASLNPSQKELAKAERELETIELLLEMGLI